MLWTYRLATKFIGDDSIKPLQPRKGGDFFVYLDMNKANYS